MIADYRLEGLRVGQGGTVEIHMKDIAHQSAVLPNHLCDLRLGLIDQLLRPGDNLLQVVYGSSYSVDRRQCGLDHAVDHAEDCLNPAEDAGLRVCGRRHSHQSHHHHSGERHRYELPAALDRDYQRDKCCKENYVGDNLHTHSPVCCAEASFDYLRLASLVSISGSMTVTAFTAPEISSGRGGTSANPCGNLLAKSW